MGLDPSSCASRLKPPPDPSLLCAAGEELLPEEDPSQFKPVPEPSLLDSFLVTSQISTYCDQVIQGLSLG